MSYFQKIKRNQWLMVFIAMIVIQTSCQKEEYDYSQYKDLGTPVISGLRAIDPAPNDSMLTQIVPGQTIVIQGNNLKGTQSVSFNGKSVGVNPVFVTNKNIVITVSSDIVFPTSNPKMKNRVKLFTNHGNTTFTIPIIPPAPQVQSISNEFPYAGDMIELKGNYLYTAKKVIFPGGVEVSNGLSFDTTGLFLKVTVPSGMASPGYADSLIVMTSGGEDTVSFYNTSGMIANFEDGDPHFGWAWWGGIKDNDAARFPGGWGNYIEIQPSGDVPAGNSAWYGDNRAVIVDPGTMWDWDAKGSPDSTGLKFQLFVKNPWKVGSLNIDFGGDDGPGYTFEYTPWESAPNNTFVTDGWITVTVPLDKFKDGDGSSASSLGGLIEGSSTPTLIRFMLNNADYDDPIQHFDAAFDNVRIVKIK